MPLWSQRGTKIQKAAQILPYRLQLALSISLPSQTTAATDTDLIHHRKYTEEAELQFYMLWRKTMRRRSDSSQEIHWRSWASILHVMKKNNETQIWFITGNTLKKLSFNSTCYEEKQWDADLIHHRKYTEEAELQFYMLWRKTMSGVCPWKTCFHNAKVF